MERFDMSITLPVHCPATTSKVERALRKRLKDCGLPFELEEGGKHTKVFLAGKFIGVICHKRGRDLGTIEPAIKRRLKELECS